MSHNIAVSIIMPNYNGDKYISESIDSVVNQTFVDWELLICDDGSSDNSLETVKKYKAKDPRIKSLKNTKNKGQSGARNTAIEQAQGRYIAFLDSDDLWSPSKLEKQIAFMQKNNLTMSYTWYTQIDKDGNFINEVSPKESYKTYSSLLKIPAIGHLTAMYDSKEFGKFYMPDVRRSDDLGLWLSVLKKCQRGGCMHEKLASYRLTPNSVSSNKFKSAKAVWNILRNVEKLNFVYALYNFSFYVTYGLAKKGIDALYRK